MVSTILSVVLIFFAVWGLSEAIYFIRLLLCHPGKRCNNYVIVVLKKQCALKQLNYIWQKIKWQGDGYAKGVIALTDLLDNKEILSCIEFIADKNIKLCELKTISSCQYLQGDF